MFQTRNPKAEARNPTEEQEEPRNTRNTRKKKTVCRLHEQDLTHGFTPVFSEFGTRISGFFRPSAFELRILFHQLRGFGISLHLCGVFASGNYRSNKRVF